MGRRFKIIKRADFLNGLAHRSATHASPAHGLSARREPGVAPTGPGGISTKYAYLSGSITVKAGQFGILYLYPQNYPYFQPLKAYVESNTLKLTIRAKVGNQKMTNLAIGHQDISHWIPGGAKGLGRDIAIIVYNHDSKSAHVTVQLAGKPLQSI